MNGPLRYSIVIEQTADPEFFGYFSPDLPGYTGVGTSVAQCVERAMEGFDEYLQFRRELGLSVPTTNPRADITLLAALTEEEELSEVASDACLFFSSESVSTTVVNDWLLNTTPSRIETDRAINASYQESAAA